MTVQEILPPVRRQPLKAAQASTSLAVYARPYNFRVDHVVPEGGTIAEMMDAAGIDAYTRRLAHCWIKDPVSGAELWIPRENWAVVRPRAGMRLTLRITPAGGGGGGRKSGLGILLSVVVMVAAAVVTWGVGAVLTGTALGTTLGTAGIGAVASLAGGLVGMAGKLAVNALVPPPSQNRAKFAGSPSSGRADSKSYSISGTRNQLNPLGPVARIYGRVRVTPVYAALPYTEILGSDQFIRLLFCPGYGPLDIDETSFRIGETPLDQYSGVQYVIHQNFQGTGLQIYTNDVDETALAVEITNDGVRTPAVAATGTLTWTGNAADGQTVTIGSRVYTFVDTLTTAANRIKIGDAAADTIDNFVAAINRSGGAGTLYSAATSINAQVSAVASAIDALTVTAKTAGTAANSIATLTTLANAAWGDTSLDGGVARVLIDQLTEEEKWISQTTGDNVDEVSFDIAFPEGLVRYQQDSNEPKTHRVARTVRFDIRYRPAGTSDPWIYLGAQAQGTLTLSGNAANGQTVTIGAKTYTFQASLTNVNGNVQIGGDAGESLDNLKAAINLEAGAGTAYAAAMTAHPTVRALSSDATTLTVEARHLGNTTGPDGNSIATAETLANGAWTGTTLAGGVDAFVATAADSFVRRGDKFTPAEPGQYEVQWRRMNAAAINDGPGIVGSTTIRDKAVLSVLRNIRHISPVNMTGITLIEMRIKATAQLQQIIDTFNLVATSMHPIWDGEAWSEPVPTRYPPWHALDALRGTANPRPVPDGKIYLPDFLDWAEACAELDGNGDPRFLCDGVFDFIGTVGQAVADIAATGRAQVTVDPSSGMYVVVRDVPQDVPVQLVTPRNSSNYRARIVFTDPPPHGIKIEFQNEAKGYATDEVIAYAPGYSKDNADPNLITTLNQPLIKRALQAYNSGRYYLGEIRLRPIEHSVTMDPEWCEMRKGRLAHLQHDAMRVGEKSARIKGIVYDPDLPNTVVAFVLDETVTMAPGEQYGLRLRFVNQSTGLADIPLVAVITEPGETSTVELEVPFDTTSTSFAGLDSLCSFGLFDRVTSPVIVKSILPGARMSARIAFKDAAPELADIDTADDIPDYDPGTTPLPAPQDRKPQPPTIADIKSDEDVMQINPDGSLQALIVIHFGALSGGTVPVDSYAARFRRTGSDAAWTTMSPKEVNFGSIALSPVDEGTAYDIEVWSVSAAGKKSDPVPINNHTVVGKLTPPPAPRDARIAAGKVFWEYPDRPVDFAGFRLHLNAGGVFDWEGASIKSQGLVTELEAAIPELVQGTYAVMIKAVDRGVRESDDYAFATLIVGQPDFKNAVETIDISGDGFTGSITNGTVTGPDLVADLELAAMWPSSPTAPMWPSDLEEAMWGASAQEMTYVHTFTPDPVSINAEMRIDANITGASWAISYSVDGGTSWMPWPGVVTAEDISYRVRVVTAPGGTPGTISLLQIIFTVPDEAETLNNVAISSAGTRLPITKAYLGFTEIKLDVREFGVETAMSAIIIDEDPVLGPMVKTVDATNTPVDGHVNAALVGPKDMNP